MSGIRTHQNRTADRRIIEDGLPAEPVNRRWTDKVLYCLSIAFASGFVPPHQPKSGP
jgi:hypothetical protein